MTDALPYRRKEIIGDCTLFLGDCRDILPTLGKVDAVVTDVPYEISRTSNGLRELDYGDWDGAGASDVAYDALRCLPDVGTVIAWCGWDQIGAISQILPDRSKRPLAWVKPNPTVMNGQHLFIPAFEIAYYGKKPGAWFGGSCVRSIWTGPAPQNRQHPTEKPVDLLKWCVLNVVPPFGCCADPFMGSGTTGVACVKLGRKFIGIEIDEGYFNIACERIRKAYAQPDMFIAPPAEKPKQEALI